MTKKSFTRLSLKLIAALLAFSFFAILNFEFSHFGHEEICHEEDCPICLVLQIIHSTKKIGTTRTTSTTEFNSFYYIKILILSALILAPATLVKQKVKLVI